MTFRLSGPKFSRLLCKEMGGCGCLVGLTMGGCTLSKDDVNGAIVVSNLLVV